MKHTLALIAFLLLAPLAMLQAQLGLPREAYGVWDRGGYNTVAAYPATRGQEYANTWQNVNSARNTFDWSGLDAQLQFADSQNENLIIQIEPVGGGSNGVPPWILAANGGGVPQYTDGIYTFGDYRDPNYKQYYTEMVQALAYHVRQDPALAANLRARIAFVRVDTGTTGDEVPYQNDSYVQTNYPQYYVDKNGPEWLAFRLWAFEVYRAAFQDGPGPVVPMLYQAVDNISNVSEWNWVVANVDGGFGAKFGGNGRGHHLTNSNDVPAAYTAFTVNPAGIQLFTRNEMDNTFLQPYFQLNIGLSMYWAAVEQLNAGMSIWDVNGNCLQDSSAHNYSSVFQFFNQWAAEVIPATAGGGFSILHEGLDSSDTRKFPVAAYGNYPASQGGTQRYTAICQAYSAQGAQMDDLNGATLGSNLQRGNTPGMIGFNDSSWNIVPGNYERFITQINPATTSKGMWRVNGPLTTSSHPYDRFARRSDHASANDTMYFDIHDNLLPTVGQRVQLNVTYLDRGTGQFSLKYDAVGNSQKTAFTVPKTGSNTWMTQSVVVTDWVFGNHGPSGCDLQLVNLANDASNPDTIIHGIEVIKLADVNVGTVGKGSVTGRNNAVAYSTIPSSVMEGQRLELTATADPGWVFTGWSGALTGTNPHPFLFPTKDTRLTATFAPASVASAVDNFDSVTWAGGTGWSGGWITSGTATPGATVQLIGGSSGIAQITRTLGIPLTNASLAFDWDLDRIGNSEPGTAEVFNGSWHVVWTQTDKGLDDGSVANLVTANIDLSSYGSISQVRFTLNSSTSSRKFYLDNVSVAGTPSGGSNAAPQFKSDPIGNPAATVGVAYSRSLSSNASDPNSNPLTFSQLAGGPSWLAVALNGTLSGTPTANDVGLNSWNVQVTSTGGTDTAILLINVSALGSNPPSALNYSINPATYTKGTAITNNLPTSSGGSVTRYSISPELTAGLTLNTTTGVITGTPSVLASISSYTVTATNSDGSATASISITVNDVAPSALTYSTNPVTYVQGTAITNNSPASNGGAVVSYAVSPALPAGLTLNTTTGVISGTPTTEIGAASYTVTASNSGGSTTASLSIAVVSAYTAWSTQFHLVQGPNGDDDGDGNSNNFEFVAGLDPTKANSAFTLKIAPVAGQSNQVAITFKPIVSGRTYTVRSSGSLTSGTWTVLSGSTSSDVGSERTVIDTGATGAKRFYIVEISNP